MLNFPSLLIDVYALFSDVSLRRQASMTQAEKFPDSFALKSDVNLFNHLVRKADVMLLFWWFCSSLT